LNKKIVFIINPIAGSGAGGRVKTQIEEYFQHSGHYDITIKLSEHIGHAKKIAGSYNHKKDITIVAVGGDGTINEVANSLVGTKIPLGIIPIGSGNGLARHLNIPTDFHKAIKIIELGRIKKMDAGIINERHFFCTAGVGFDAHVGNAFAANTKRGFGSYLKAVLQEFRMYKPKKYKLKIDNKKVTERAFILTFANASQYGNNAYIAPLASTTDGFIDISILKPFPLFTAPGLALRLFTKKIHESRYVKVYRGKKMVLKRKKPGDIHIDGEALTMGKTIKVEVLPKTLKVLTP